MTSCAGTLRRRFSLGREKFLGIAALKCQLENWKKNNINANLPTESAKWPRICQFTFATEGGGTDDAPSPRNYVAAFARQVRLYKFEIYLNLRVLKILLRRFQDQKSEKPGQNLSFATSPKYWLSNSEARKKDFEIFSGSRELEMNSEFFQVTEWSTFFLLPVEKVDQ